MSAKNCTTHHHACDCREAMFAEMVELLSFIIDGLPEKPNPVGMYSLGAVSAAVVDDSRVLIARATDQGEMK